MAPHKSALLFRYIVFGLEPISSLQLVSLLQIPYISFKTLCLIMGNTPVTVGLHTDQSCYTAGDLVTGKIYISVTKPQPATVLNIRILGEEHTIIHHTTNETTSNGSGSNSTTTTREHDHYEEANSAFFNLDYPIHMFPKQIEVGQYEFPFTINLPANLPSSIMCRKNQSYAQVHYQITAKLQTTTGLFQQAPQKTQVLQILAAPPSGFADDSALQLPNERVPVTKCCCRKQGHVALAASFDKTVVRPNETIGVAFTANNQSTVRVDTVRVILEEYIEWRAHGRSEKVHRVLQKVDLPASDYPELAKLHRKPNTYFGGSNNTMDQHPLIHNNDTPGRSSIQVVVPTGATDSYHGRWIEVRHVLSVRLLTPGCCTTNPEACARLQICRTTAPLTPSAPPTPLAPPSPSAPPSEYDMGMDMNIPAHASAPIVEAEAVLPAGWSAQTAEVVIIPMVEATLLDNKHPNQYDNFV